MEANKMDLQTTAQGSNNNKVTLDTALLPIHNNENLNDWIEEINLAGMSIYDCNEQSLEKLEKLLAKAPREARGSKFFFYLNGVYDACYMLVNQI
jgi:hypothetical protein